MTKFVVKTAVGKKVIKSFKTHDAAEDFAMRNSYETRLRIWRVVGVTPGCDGEWPDRGSWYQGAFQKGA